MTHLILALVLSATPESQAALSAAKWAKEIEDPNHDVTAELIASAFRDSAAQVGKSVQTVSDMMTDCDERMAASLSDEAIELWQPWFEKVNDYCRQHPPADLEAWKTRWEEIAAGLVYREPAPIVPAIKVKPKTTPQPATTKKTPTKAPVKAAVKQKTPPPAQRPQATKISPAAKKGQRRARQNGRWGPYWTQTLR